MYREREGLGFRDISSILETQMEKKMENAIGLWLYGNGNVEELYVQKRIITTSNLARRTLQLSYDYNEVPA